MKTAIAKASSLDEIERLNQMLRSGAVSAFESHYSIGCGIKDVHFSDAGDEAKGGGEWGRNGDGVKS